MELFSLFNGFPIADSGMASHSEWKSVFFRLGHLRSYFPSVANNRLCGQAVMAALRSNRIPNTFISTSAERGSDGQIFLHITFAKQHTGEQRMQLSFISVFVSITKSSTLQQWKHSYFDFQSTYLNPHWYVIVMMVI